MANTAAEADERILDGGDEPVLVWAVTEDILLANDAALLLLAESEDAGPLRDTRLTLARTLARVVNAEGPYGRASLSVRTHALKDASPFPLAAEVKADGWRAALRLLAARFRVLLRLLRDR